jgi:DNA-binding NarL/FixJ family response regulator
MSRHDDSRAPNGVGGAGEYGTSPERQQRVLIVEDQALIALALAADLTAMYCEVVGRAASGDAAVELARRLQPDIVVMDVHLVGGIDGIEAAALIKAECAPRLIFVTAYADGPDRPRMEALRPAAILGKPYHPNELNLAVNVSGRQRVRGRATHASATAGD